MWKTIALILAAFVFLGNEWGDAHAQTYQITDIACEVTPTAGQGTLTLGGAAPGGYLDFHSSGVVEGNVVPYTLTNGLDAARVIEVGWGTYFFGPPATLVRVPIATSNGVGSPPLAIPPNTTSIVCISPTAQLMSQPGNGFNADLFAGSSQLAYTSHLADLFAPKTLNANDFPNSIITPGMIANGTGISVFGRYNTTPGPRADITGSASQLLGLSADGLTLGFSLLRGDNFPTAPGIVPNGALANMPATTIKCNPNGVAGPPVDCTVNQIKTMLGL
jgi:hypothetical protein